VTWFSQNWQEVGCVLMFSYTTALLAVVSQDLGVNWLSCLLSNSLNYSWVSNAVLTVTGYAETKMSFATT